jgi:uncharacterized protein involved in exopolysaccharide biosynthesis
MLAEQNPTSAAPPPIDDSFPLRDVLIRGFYSTKLVLICIATGLTIGVMGALLSPPRYTAESLIQVLPPPNQALTPTPPIVGDTSSGLTAGPMKILQSNPVVEDAIRRMGDRNFSTHSFWRKAPPLAAMAERFKRALHVDADTGSNIIHLTFTARRPDVAAKALQALIVSFGSPHANTSLDPAYDQQGDEVRRYGSELRESENRIRQIEARHGIIDVNQDIALADSRLDNLTQRLSQARERATTMGGEVAAAKAAIALTPAQILQSRDNTNAVSNDDTRNTLLRLRQERAHLITRYSPTWGGVKEVDAKIAAAEAQLSQNAKDRFFTDHSQRNPVLSQLDSQLSTAKVESNAVSRAISELERQANQARARIAELRDAADQIRALQRGREVTEGIYKQLSVSQAGAALRDQSDALRDSGFRVIQPPEPPLKARNLAPAFVVAGLILGVMLAVVASVAAALGHPIFLTPAQAARALQLPNLASFDLTESDPQSPAGHAAISRFATQLMDASVGGQPLKVILISSTEAEEKSDFALELGRAIALEYRQRTLVVDFDAKPDHQGRTARLPGARMTTTGTSPLSLGHSATTRLWVALDAGRSSFGDPRLPVADVKASLDAIRPHFDRVLIVARKDFGEYATRRLYALADANILLVRAGKTRVPAVRRLKETILSAGGDILGFVFTSRGYYIPEALYRWL